MRILHISDLHFGAHAEHLLQNLSGRVEMLAPDVIVVTGDLADRPAYDGLLRARDYLDRLEKLCPGRNDGAARLIVVPGNHDIGYFKGNLALSNSNYQRLFGKSSTASFYSAERVWIYGFNSARERGVGANGYVLPSDLARFDTEYDKARKAHPNDFDGAYKIVALHHHPLPVSYDSKYARWVTLLNSASFLDQMIKHKIDLVIHGHEHVHAQCVFSKRVRNEDRSLTVVSVGSALHKSPGRDGNRFNVIEMTGGSIRVESYQAQSELFDDEPIDKYIVRDAIGYDEPQFRKLVAEKGHKYERLVTRATLHIDGDVERSVDFRDLNLRSANSERARSHRITLPQTSGYIDLPSAWEIVGEERRRELRFETLSKAANDKRVEGKIEYDGALAPGVPFSLRCCWWAVNAMAMSREQSRKKYPVLRAQEYTHFPVLDPVERMTCMVNFPPGFSPSALPSPFVASVVHEAGQGWRVGDSDTTLEYRLRGSIIMDGTPEKGLKATMEIMRPVLGLTYGFRWTLPDDAADDSGLPGAEAASFVAALLAFHGSKIKDAGQKEKLGRMLGLAGEYVRARLAQGFEGHLEYGLMVFDAGARKMMTVAACRYSGDRFEWRDQEHLVFDYGEGIGGRAFKTKLPLVYFDEGPDGRRTEPDYYRKVAGDPGYAVLFALPIHHPKLATHVYAVLCCGSSDATCPLRNVGKNGVPISKAAVKADQDAVSEGLYGDLMQLSKTLFSPRQT